MRILVVGSGGREHALSWKLSAEAEVFAAPGNPGIVADGIPCHSVQATDIDGLLALVRAERIDLVVFGPEEPLVRGISDALRSAGVAVYGPGADGARLEASKAFSKEVMARAGVPTAEFGTFTQWDEATEYARTRFGAGKCVAVKASGNALGKGVVVTSTLYEAEEAIREMMVARTFGEAGATVIIEDRLSGDEFSLLTIVGDENFVSLPVAQDHKRVGDGDTGPNTGGMGAFSPVASVAADLIAQTEESVVRPLLAELKRRGIVYRGTLFSGLMSDGGDPLCLEYNVRFGDPETQAILMRLTGGFAAALDSAANGGRIEPPTVSDDVAVTVVVASGGYPGLYRKGMAISLGTPPAGTKIFHAGTAVDAGNLASAGGRVMNASATGATLSEARERAYLAAATVEFEGAFYRRDIAGSGPQG